MRKAFVLVLLVGLAAFAAGAWSAAPPSPAEKKLQRDVKVLQAEVNALQKSVKALKKEDADLELGIGAALLYSFCGLAITADDLQGTWQIVDQLSAATQTGKTYFGPQTPVSDSLGTAGSVCQVLGVPRSQALPPSTASFTALLALLQRSALFRQSLH